MNAVEFQIYLAAEIYIRRSELGLSLGQVAKRVGTTTTTIMEIERGDRVPSLKQTVAIMNALALKLKIVVKEGDL